MSDPNLQILISAKNLTRKAFKDVQSDVGKVNKQIGLLSSAFKGLAGVASGFGLAALGRSFVETGVYMDRMRRSMETISGSARQTAIDIEFLKRKSDEFGQIYRDQVKGFNLIAAATKDTKIAGDATKQMYADLMQSMTAFQLSQDDAYNSVRAIQQMLAKGTIQAEEFRGQFGERIPVAFEAMKVATASTGKELQDMMKKGELISEKVVPRLLRVMALMTEEGIKKASKSAQAEINRLKNSWDYFKTAVMDSGVTAEVASVLSGISDSIRDYIKNNSKELADFVAHSTSIVKTVFGGPLSDITTILSGVKTSILELTNGIDEILKAGGNSGIKEYGVLGFYLFGPNIGIIASVIHEIAASINVLRGQALVESGVLSMEQFESMDAKKLREYLNEFEKYRNSGDTLGLKEQKLKITKDLLAGVEQRIKGINEQTAKAVNSTEFEKLLAPPAFLSGLKLNKLELEKNRHLKTQKELEKEISDIRKKRGLPDLNAPKETPEEAKARIKAQKDAIELEAREEKQLSQAFSRLKYTVAAQEKIKAVLRYSAIDAGKISKEFTKAEAKTEQTKEKLVKIQESLLREYGIHIDINDALAEAAKLYKDAYSISDTNKANLAIEKLGRSLRMNNMELSGYMSEQELGIENIRKQYADLADTFEKQQIDVDLTPQLRGAIDAYKKAIQTRDFRDSIRDGVISGMSDGFDAVENTVVSKFSEALSIYISDAITASLQESMGQFGTSQMASTMLTAGGGILGGLAGAAMGSVAGAVLGGGGEGLVAGLKRRMEEQKKLHEDFKNLTNELQKQREETQRNTAALRSGGLSSYSFQLLRLSEDLRGETSSLRDNMVDLKKLVKQLSSQTIPFGGDISSFDAQAYSNMLKSFSEQYNVNLKDIFSKYLQVSEDFDLTSMITKASMFKDILDQINNTEFKSEEYKTALITLFDGVYTALDEYLVNIDDIQKQIIKSSSDLLSGASGAFLTESEATKLDFEKNARDMVSGLLDTFQAEGVFGLGEKLNFGLFRANLREVIPITEEYIQSITSLSSVEEMAVRLISDFSHNQEAVNQILTVTNNLIETRILQERKYAESIRDTMQASLSTIYDAYEDLDFKMSGLTRKAWVEARIVDFEDVFKSVGSLTEQEFSKYVGFVRELYDIQMEQEEVRFEYLKQSAEKIKSLVTSIDNTIFSIQTGPLNVSTAKTKADEMVNVYEELYKAAKVPGDDEATQKFVDFAQQYLQIYQNAYKSSENYINMYNKVISDLDEVKGIVQTEDYMKLLADRMKTNTDLANGTYYNTRDTSQLMQVNNNRLVEIRDVVMEGFFNLVNASGYDEVLGTLNSNFANLINTINVSANVGNTGAPVYYEPPSPAIAPSVPSPGAVSTPGYTEPSNNLTFSPNAQTQQSLAARYYSDRIRSMDLGTISLFNSQLEAIPNVELILDSKIMRDWHDMFEASKVADDAIVMNLPGGGKVYLWNGALTYQDGAKSQLISFNQSDSINYVASRAPEIAAYWRSAYGISDFSMYSLPGYQKEGLAMTPQVARIAESQPEVVMNFDRFMKLIDALESMVGSGAGGSNQTIEIKLGDQLLDRIIMKRIGKYNQAQDRRGVSVSGVYR